MTKPDQLDDAVFMLMDNVKLALCVSAAFVVFPFSLLFVVAFLRNDLHLLRRGRVIVGSAASALLLSAWFFALHLVVRFLGGAPW